MSTKMKDIKGYEGLYKISNYGDVWTVGDGNRRARKLKPSVSEGYFTVNLYKNKKAKSFRVHRLVAEAFIPNIENKRTVNHIDENKLNNYVGNLEWATDKENANHGSRTNRSSVGRYKAVLQLSPDEEPIRIFKSIKHATLETGVPSSLIVRVAKGRRNLTHGYKWRYVQ